MPEEHEMLATCTSGQETADVLARALDGQGIAFTRHTITVQVGDRDVTLHEIAVAMAHRQFVIDLLRESQQINAAISARPA